jgi:drug/metabolite transporter (DMT)-like permease
VRAPSARYTLVALLFSLLWASGFVAMKVALRDAPPLMVMTPRLLIAAGALLALARLRGSVIPGTWSEWRPLVLIGVLNNALYLGCTNYLLRHVSAGTASVIGSTSPLMLALLAPWFLGEPLTVRKGAGLATSYLGVTTVMWTRRGGEDETWAMLAWLACVVFLVAGTILFKRWRLPHDLTAMTGIQLLGAGIVLALPSLLLESFADVHLTATLIAAQAYLIVVVSGAAMLLWLWLLQHGDATRASAWFFLNPVQGLALAALILGEPLRAGDFVGAALVAAGIYVVQRA